MTIETIDDIIEELADSLEVYGGCTYESSAKECHHNEHKSLNKCCRTRFSSVLRERIYKAIENENELSKTNLI